MPASESPPAGGRFPWWFVAFLAATHVLLFVAAFPPFGIWPLAFVAPVPLAWAAIRATSTRSLLLVVLAVQWLGWMWLQRWLVQVTLVGYPLLALYLAAYAAIFAVLVRRIAHHPRTRRWPMAIVVPLLWVGLETLRGELVFDGYGWFLLAHPLVEAPVIAQSADLLGTYFVGTLAAAVAGAVIDGMRTRADGSRRRIAVAGAAVVLALHAANAGYGWWRLDETGGEPLLSIVALQTNLPQDNKIGWSASAQAEDFAAFCRQTIEAVAIARAAGRRVDLVTWPETMLPGIGLEPATTAFLRRNDYWPGGRFAEGIAALAEGVGAPLLVGSACFVGVDVVEGRWVYERQHNSAYLVTGDAPYQRYDKVFLTPFGEVMPYISRWSWLEERLLALGAPGMSFALEPGASIRRIEVPVAAAVARVATPICFEDTVGRVCRRMAWVDDAKAIDLFVNLSNDGWFGGDDGGRRQHAQIARWRCIENRVPMVRCANTGLTLAIDAAGRILARAGGAEPAIRAPASMWAEINRDDRRTLYGRVGETWAWLCVVAAGGLVALTAVGSGDDG